MLACAHITETTVLDFEVNEYDTDKKKEKKNEKVFITYFYLSIYFAWLLSNCHSFL